MYRFHRSLLVTLVLIAGTGNSLAAPNQLAGHPSPYLALHANDPVNWQSWQAGAFDAAIADNRLILVSVGYFSCHWCHVMQRQSYQDAETAGFLNNHYISVKVDRELNPELDRRLIAFVQQLRGVAGWPLNVFLTPDGYPLTGFTYLPRDDFLQLLQRLDAEWQQNHASLSASAQAYYESGVLEQEQKPADLQVATADLLAAFVRQAMRAADELQGGFGNTRKFPSVPQLDALLDSYLIGKDPEIAEFIQLTLHSMATRNLLDHVNGGFFRYTTDPDWQTPHFEKMLYDNALLAGLYLKAEGIWPGQGYADTALRTLDFIEQQLLHPGGAYMSSLSAIDQDGREGGAYLWTQARLEALLTAEEYSQLQQQFQLDSTSSEFLLRPVEADSMPVDTGIDSRILQKLQQQKTHLMPVDDKRLASWNAMMLDTLVTAAHYDTRFVATARRQYRSMRKLFFADGKLIRFAGHADLAAAAFEDYAYSAAAFLHFGEQFNEREAIDLSRDLVEQAHRLFYRDQRWQTGSASLLPMDAGRWTIADRVFYSASGLWLRSALAAPELDPVVRASANHLLRRVTREILDLPFDYGSLILLRVREEG